MPHLFLKARDVQAPVLRIQQTIPLYFVLPNFSDWFKYLKIAANGLYYSTALANHDKIQ